MFQQHISLLLSLFFSATVAMSTHNSKGLVLVTGGSRGIGRATCHLLAKEKYDIAVNYNSNHEAVRSLISTLDKEYPLQKCIAFQSDISKEEQVAKLFYDVNAAFGRDPIGLVNNAGIIGPRQNDITSLTSSDLSSVLETNLYGSFYCTREFVRRASVKRGGKGGSIVNISSGSAYIGTPLLYAMSKGAMDSMAAGLAKSLPDEGIRINTIAPGMTDTDMIDKDKADGVIGLVPMRRLGKPEEIAEGVVFFLGQGSSFCSGAKLRMAGGRP